MKEHSIAKGILNKQLPYLGQFLNDLADTLCSVGSRMNDNKIGRAINGLLQQSWRT